MDEFEFEVDYPRNHEFDPFELKIKVDSIEKLAALLTMFNSNGKDIIESFKSEYQSDYFKHGVPNYDEIWRFLNEKFEYYESR